MITELLSYDWPGNVRELENCVERMILFSEKDQITDSFLTTRGPSMKIENEVNGAFQLDVIERETIIKALDQSEWNKVKAAKLLNIGRKALYNKINKFHIEPKQ